MPRLNYQKVNWEDAPSTATPLNAENLDNMDNGLAALYQDVADLEEEVENIEVTTDITNLPVSFGEPGEPGVDDAPLQPSLSPLGDIITGIHSRIRAIQTNFPDLTELQQSIITINSNIQSLRQLILGLYNDVYTIRSTTLSGDYINSGIVRYLHLGNFMIFAAEFTPNQNIQSSIGQVRLGLDTVDFGTFMYPIAYPVTAGGTTYNPVYTHRDEAWTIADDLVFRISGQYTANTKYYFGGVAILAEPEIIAPDD